MSRVVQFTLRPGHRYDLSVLEPIVHSFDDTGRRLEEYDNADWRDCFSNGVYLGPDRNGVEPLFDRPAQAQLIAYHTNRVSRWATPVEIEDAVTQSVRPYCFVYGKTKYLLEV
jgi:hypothetical protein